MTDSAVLLPNSIGITSDLKFDLKDSAARSRSYRASINPTNKSVFNPLDTCIIYIPGGRRNTYVDCTQSYLQYTIKNNDTTAGTASQTLVAFNLDNNAGSVINRMDVFHASNLLESVQNYNQLMTIMLDTNLNPAQKLGLSTAYGTSTVTGPASGTDVSRQGAQLQAAFYSGSSTSYFQQQTFAMPILSGVFGLGADKALPVGRLSDDIRIEFTFESQYNAVVYNTRIIDNTVVPTPWQIVDVTLQLMIIELSDEAENMVSSVISPSHPIYLHGNSFRSYTSTLAAATSGGVSVLVPARFGSLKSLFLCPRRADTTAGQYQLTSYSLSSRINPNISTYWWRVGSSLLPARPIVLENTTTCGAYAQAFMELQKCFHSVSTPANASVLPANIYNVSDYATATTFRQNAVNPAQTPSAFTSSSVNGNTTYQNGFLIGQELESFALRSDIMLSGYNTLSQQIFFEGQINNAIGSNAYTLNFFANYDHVLVIDQGIISVRF